MLNDDLSSFTPLILSLQLFYEKEKKYIKKMPVILKNNQLFRSRSGHRY